MKKWLGEAIKETTKCLGEAKKEVGRSSLRKLQSKFDKWLGESMEEAMKTWH